MSAEVKNRALVQLWTTSPSRDGLTALNGAWDLWPGRRCRGVVSSEGRKRRLRAGSPSELAENACKGRFNYLEITLEGIGGKSADGAKTLAAGALRVSPLNEWWARLRADAVPDGADWRRRVEDLSTQSAVAWNELREWRVFSGEGAARIVILEGYGMGSKRIRELELSELRDALQR